MPKGDPEYDGWFYFANEDLDETRFGYRSVKHRNELLVDVAEEDPNYLRWLIREGEVNREAESLIEDALTEAGEDLE